MHLKWYREQHVKFYERLHRMKSEAFEDALEHGSDD